MNAPPKMNKAPRVAVTYFIDSPRFFAARRRATQQSDQELVQHSIIAANGGVALQRPYGRRSSNAVDL